MIVHTMFAMALSAVTSGLAGSSAIGSNVSGVAAVADPDATGTPRTPTAGFCNGRL